MTNVKKYTFAERQTDAVNAIAYRLNTLSTLLYVLVMASLFLTIWLMSDAFFYASAVLMLLITAVDAYDRAKFGMLPDVVGGDWMKCPTCENANDGKYCSCGAVIDVPELQPDPYAHDIHNDATLHLMCAQCLHESSQDI